MSFIRNMLSLITILLAVAVEVSGQSLSDLTGALKASGINTYTTALEIISSDTLGASVIQQFLSGGRTILALSEGSANPAWAQSGYGADNLAKLVAYNSFSTREPLNKYIAPQDTSARYTPYVLRTLLPDARNRSVLMAPLFTRTDINLDATNVYSATIYCHQQGDILNNTVYTCDDFRPLPQLPTNYTKRGEEYTDQSRIRAIDGIAPVFNLTELGLDKSAANADLTMFLPIIAPSSPDGQYVLSLSASDRRLLALNHIINGTVVDTWNKYNGSADKIWQYTTACGQNITIDTRAGKNSTTVAFNNNKPTLNQIPLIGQGATIWPIYTVFRETSCNPQAAAAAYAAPGLEILATNTTGSTGTDSSGGSSSGGSGSLGGIIGGVVGGVLALVLIVVLAVVLRRRQRKRRSHAIEDATIPASSTVHPTDHEKGVEQEAHIDPFITPAIERDRNLEEVPYQPESAISEPETQVGAQSSTIEQSITSQEKAPLLHIQNPDGGPSISNSNQWPGDRKRPIVPEVMNAGPSSESRQSASKAPDTQPPPIATPVVDSPEATPTIQGAGSSTSGLPEPETSSTDPISRRYMHHHDAGPAEDEEAGSEDEEDNEIDLPPTYEEAASRPARSRTRRARTNLGSG